MISGDIAVAPDRYGIGCPAAPSDSRSAAQLMPSVAYDSAERYDSKMSTDLKSAASAILTAYLRTTPMDADAVGPLLADIIQALSAAIEPARPILTLSEPTGPNGRRRRIKAGMAAISANMRDISAK